MSDSPPNAAAIKEAVDEALHGTELEPEEAAEVLGFANRELPNLHTPDTSYFVLGSYRDPFIRRVRAVQNQLNKRVGTYPFLLGDLPDLEIDRLPGFRIQFHLLATHADYVVGVFEQDAGGEITELGKISSTPYFEKSYALPRDYAWLTDRRLETLEDVTAAATVVHYNDDLDEEQTRAELESLVTAARRKGIDVTADELLERIADRDLEGAHGVSYSWVHVNEFRLFELHGRCFPWTTEEELRTVANRLP